MLNTLFDGLFDSTAHTLSVPSFLLCLGVSLLIGLLLALSYSLKTRHSKSFVVTLATLPAVVCVVIMMVNGSIGAGVAVAGTFSLVRFRSVPGTAREIGAIFLAMGSGLAAGMGYLAYALLFSVIVGGICTLYNCTGFGQGKFAALNRTLRITIPEDLNYATVFDAPLRQYTHSHTICEVKTTNMGSLFRLTYQITLKEPGGEKALLDQLRTRNGNLEVSLSSQDTTLCEL